MDGKELQSQVKVWKIKISVATQLQATGHILTTFMNTMGL
jgi:hypothetical protein